MSKHEARMIDETIEIETTDGVADAVMYRRFSGRR
jgi:hypothetical protein